jgi:quaternary ammonium compound-resistance protein SugE
VAWIYILIACVLEIVWIYSLKGMDGFSKLYPWAIIYVLCGFGAAFSLSLSMKSLPVGSTYAVWVGVTATGANLIGMLFLDEPYRASKVLFIALIVAGVVGLKLSTNE